MKTAVPALTAIVIVLAAGAAGAQRPNPIDRIREADIKADLFTLAGDAMRGREGGTIDEMNASVWLAERAREAGLLPAGENGTYFQFFPLERFRVSASSLVTLGGKTLVMGRDVLPDNTVIANVDAPVVTMDAAAVAGAGEAIRNKVLVVRYVAPAAPAAGPAAGPGATQALRTWLRGIQQRAAPANPVAIVALVPDSASDQWARVAVPFTRGTYALDPNGTAAQRVAPRGVPVLYVRESALGGPLVADAKLTASIFTDSFTYPSVNVIAKVPGRDATLRNEYVLFSAHQDHDGERYPVNGPGGNDDIWNGADDNATTAVALLAIGRAVSAAPLKRSALFVWHGSEERGLMGSRWFVEHPLVPLTSIVACLNGDLIGRNDPTTAALLGVLTPHRNSQDLVDVALAANKSVAGFALDHSWDDPDHREGWYYRSDHLSYARHGVPALFFTTLLHPDYHTPFDNPDRIDITKLTKMTRWMYETGRVVGETDKRPALEPGFKLERCRDSTGTYC